MPSSCYSYSSDCSPESARYDSSAFCEKLMIASRLCRITSRIIEVLALGTFTHTTFGGGPSRRASWRKSESFETMIKSCCLAYSQISLSVASASSSSPTCDMSVKSSRNRRISFRERFWSRRSITQEWRGGVHGLRRTSTRLEYCRRSIRGNRR